MAGSKRFTRLLFLSALLFIAAFCNAQGLSGRVTSEETGHPIAGASIYFNNTSIGTISNEEGNFTLSNAISGELIITAVGYERMLYKVSLQELGNKKLHFKLTEKENTLQDVLVLSDATRKKYLALFREFFLGITEEADNSSIRNLNAVYFVNAGDGNGIIALSDTPLVIINRKLGYKIDFDLIQFYLNQKTGLTSFYGYTRYNETGNKKKFIKNRRNVYYGGTLHFYRALIADKLEEQGYSLYRIITDSLKQSGSNNFISAGKMDMAIPVKAKDIIRKDSVYDVYYASFADKMMVQYHKKPAGKNYLSRKIMINGSLPNGYRAYLHLQRPGPVMIDGSGVLQEPTSIMVSGYWMYEKAANLLPFNYQPE
ncbi:MAG: carboxypeptidase-like regulatory domain-containing protein [Ferruginibacter sp.]